MKIFREHDLKVYSSTDLVLQQLQKSQQEGDTDYATHQWLANSLAKRTVFGWAYADLLERTDLKILDVGGGYSAITRELAKRHDYHVLDIMAHDDHSRFAELSSHLGGIWIEGDWDSFTPKHYDVVVANDLFPNVDQRVRAFVDKFLPHTGELRLTLTFYNSPRAYRVKRIDADEIFHILAWDGAQVARALADYVDGEALASEHESIFDNGRQVCGLTLTNASADGGA